MKRTCLFALAALALAISPSARADGTPDMFGVRVWTEATQALTRAAPTTAATDGMSLDRVVSFYVVVSAPAGQTLTGAGQIDFWRYDQALDTSWHPGSVGLSWSMSGCAGLASCTSQVYGGGMARGRILAAANGVGLSGAGTTVQVQILAVTSERSSVSTKAQP
jgi:hypothetical protein